MLAYITDVPQDKEGPIRSGQLLLIRLEQNSWMDYAARQWGDHARGELELTLKDKILVFLRAPRQLESFVQAQYSISVTTLMVEVLKYMMHHLNTRIKHAWQWSCQRLHRLLRSLFLHSLRVNPTSFHDSNTKRESADGRESRGPTRPLWIHTTTCLRFRLRNTCDSKSFRQSCN